MNGNTESILRGGQFKKLIESSMAEIRNKTNLKRVEVEVLYFLSRNAEHNTMKDICNYLQMNKGHISIALDSLTKQGYVIQQQDLEDHRYVHYILTDKADEIVLQTTEAFEVLSKRVLEGIAEEDIAVFERVAGQMRANIYSILKEEKRI